MDSEVVGKKWTGRVAHFRPGGQAQPLPGSSGPGSGCLQSPRPDGPTQQQRLLAQFVSAVQAFESDPAKPVAYQCVDLKGSDPLLTVINGKHTGNLASTAGMKGSDPILFGTDVAWGSG